MLKDVTLGQFFPGQTPIHKLDPRTKLVLVIVYIVALFLAKWFVSYAVIAAFLALVIAMSRIRLKVVLKNLKPLLFIIILTALLNLFYGQGEPIAQFWIFKITRSGIQNAIFMVLRISLLVAGTFSAMNPGYSYEELRSMGYSDYEARKLIRVTNGRMTAI